MTRLTWGAIGQRLFQAGVDRGVLYVDGADGVAWNGLVSVSEHSIGGEPSSYYIDGVKYSLRMSPTEFEGTMEAYTYPDEFVACEGMVSIANGLYATDQRRKAFNLCYRTMLGNDVDGVDFGYKLHVLYNVMASPSDQKHGTLGDSVSPDNFSWKLTAKPPSLTNYKPTAHFVIDSREASHDLMTYIESILYGSDTAAPRLPDVEELIFIFNSFQVSAFDAGTPTEVFYITFDGGAPPSTVQTSTIDGGTP